MNKYYSGDLVKVPSGVYALFCAWSVDFANYRVDQGLEYPECDDANCLCRAEDSDLDCGMTKPSKSEFDKFWAQNNDE